MPPSPAQETTGLVDAPKVDVMKKRHLRPEAVDHAPKTSVPKETLCSTCKLSFESRTKLFRHLQETGHAALKFQQQQPPAAAKKKTKKK